MTHAHAAGVIDRVGDGGRRRVDDDLADGLRAERARRLVARLKRHADAWRIHARGNLVLQEGAGDRAAQMIFF